MRVLFVRSGNNGLDPITQNQGESLIELGLELYYFDIIGNGIFGYLYNVYRLFKTLKKLNPDIVHSHYSLSGFIASLTLTKKPIIASLMGSDVNDSGKFKLFVIRIFITHCWNKTIVKSKEMKETLSLENIQVIPNGINLNRFKVMDQLEAQNKLGWENNSIHLLFGSNPSSPEKNFRLAMEAKNICLNEYPNITLHFLTGIDREQIHMHYNAADILLLTSSFEGSPNVIKEAMACGCPIVATRVGDVESILNNTPGCYIAEFESQDVAEKIKLAILFNGRTQGRYQLENYRSDLIAKKIEKVYLSVYKKHEVK
jgi:teichuronic acid biosynthesis glycosyltransferase TuaC